jgi:hypothetical protein
MEKALGKLVEKLKASGGANLEAVVLYGSPAAGEYQAKHSDLNVLCLVSRVGTKELDALHPAIEWWARQGHPAPFVFTREELRDSADVFAIELFDMKQQHRMLLGEDFLASLDVPMNLHRLQVERELRAAWVRLRRGYLLAPRHRRALLDLMTTSVSTFTALFRHALLALGEPPPQGKRAAIERVASLCKEDAAPFLAILDVREGKLREAQVDVRATLAGYLNLVEGVTQEVDRRFAPAR